MIRTSFGGQGEHTIAYLGTALVMGLAYRKRPRLLVQCGLLIAYAAALEATQMFLPSRNASIQDFAASAAGVAIGGAFLWLARDWLLGEA